jgi:hypothetical protein
MTIVYLPANRCYGVMFGDSLTSLDGQFFFESRKDLAWVARTLGLKVSGDRLVLA